VALFAGSRRGAPRASKTGKTMKEV